MYIHVFALFVIFFIAFCIISKEGLFDSIFYTIFFIITLWINIPCFINISNLSDNNLMMLLFKLSNELGIGYALFANTILCVVLYFQTSFSNRYTYTYKQVKRRYDVFGDDASELYIIGKDLDFLDKREFKKQTNRIIHLKDKCKLLCEATTDTKLRDLYERMNKQGVEIRFYTENDHITNLKGQIKINQNGDKKAIFMIRKNTKYTLVNIENQFLVASILEQYNEVYENSNTFD